MRSRSSRRRWPVIATWLLGMSCRGWGPCASKGYSPPLARSCIGTCARRAVCEARACLPRTVDYVHAVLRKAFNDAVWVDQILASNPAERAKRPRRVAAATREVWTGEQLLAFLMSAESHRLYPFFHLAAYSGARRGELLNLRWTNVDLDDATIRIRGTTAVIAGKRVEGTTKGGRERVVTLGRGTIKILTAHRANQGRDRLLAGPDWASGDYAFTRSLGLPLYPGTGSQLMPKLIAAHNNPASGSPPAIVLPHA